MGATPADLARLGDADFNVVLYPEIAAQAASWLQRMFRQPFTKIDSDRRVGDPRVHRGSGKAGRRRSDGGADELIRRGCRGTRARSTSTYLTGKRVFIFGDATHAVAAARIASDELGFKVVGLGTYSREFGREIREAAKLYDVEPLITDDYLEVEAKVAELQPELVLGTQMERHIAKRLGVPCAVISAPVHVQDFPARYAPQMGFEGANVIFDTWVHPLMMGLEEHLLTMFRDDFEFKDGAVPSHLGVGHGPAPRRRGFGCRSRSSTRATAVMTETATAVWAADAEKELRKIPFFVRGKARRNTERFANENGVATITIETLVRCQSALLPLTRRRSVSSS